WWGPGTSNHVARSYLAQPLKWSDEAWGQLMKLGGSAGIAVCQLHGLGKQDETAPSVLNFEGLLLRAQRDGAVVRRHRFWHLPDGLSPASPDGISVISFSGGGSGDVQLVDGYPWELYADTPPN